MAKAQLPMGFWGSIPGETRATARMATRLLYLMQALEHLDAPLKAHLRNVAQDQIDLGRSDAVPFWKAVGQLLTEEGTK
jgi:hypothetical protein